MALKDYINPEMMTGAATLAGGLFSPNYKNPAKAATSEIDNIIPLLTKVLSPYTDIGTEQYKRLPGLYEEYLDPNALIKKIGSGYQESPGYQWQKQQAENSISNAAAAGGMLGTPQHEQLAGQMAYQLANQDFYNYLKEALGLYNQGVGGITDIGKTGLSTTEDLLSSIANTILTKAGYQYAGQAGENQAKSTKNSNIWSGIGGLLGGASKVFGSKEG